jgi:hypothetical protein
MKKPIKINNQEIGYVRHHICVKDVCTFYIDKFEIYLNHRRHGHFKTMLAETLLIAKEYKCPTITLRVGSCEESDEFLINLYSKYGFKEIEPSLMQKILVY